MTRLVLAGNNEAACLVLDLLIKEADVTELLVVPAPERSTARWHSSLEAVASARGAPVFRPDSINDPTSISRIVEFAPDLFLSVYYTQVFRPELLTSLRCPILNIHPSLLPRHRGNAPLIWAIAEGDGKTGVTVHHVDNGIDTGRVVLQRPLPIHPEETGYELHRKTARLVAGCVRELLAGLRNSGTIPTGYEQTGEATTHTSRDPRLNHIDWNLSATRVRNIVRALAPPLPSAYSLFGEIPLDVHRVQDDTQPGSHALKRCPGFVERSSNGLALVWASDRRLVLRAVAVEGRVYTGARVWDIPGLREGALLR